MLSKRYIHPGLYAISDYLMTALAWALFFILRRHLLRQAFLLSDLLTDAVFWSGTLLIPLGWLMLYAVTGSYLSVYKKSRLAEFTKTFIVTVVGTVILFFVFLLDDAENNHRYYYLAFGLLFLLTFVFTFAGRAVILNTAKRQIIDGLYRFPAVIVGHADHAARIHRDMEKKLRSGGYDIKGFVPLGGDKAPAQRLTLLGPADHLEAIIDREGIQLVVVATDKDDRHLMEALIERLSEKDVEIKIQPNIIDILSGSVKTSNVLGPVLMDLKTGLMPEWQQNIKRLLDVIVAFCAFLLLLPFMLYIALRVKLSSRGPIFYSQERIGYKGRPFRLYKFRSMFTDAEAAGPALSSDHDPRITRWGKVMRKWRLDELPQLWNILRGDMTLVGPRPERRFYIDQIVRQYPYYKYLLKVKPGLTSWGLVQFGYAENVQQMIERCKDRKSVV